MGWLLPHVPGTSTVDVQLCAYMNEYECMIIMILWMLLLSAFSRLY